MVEGPELHASPLTQSELPEFIRIDYFQDVSFVIPKTMQAVVYRGVNDLRLETLPVPRIGAGDILVKVAVCGVCPTDIKKIHYGTVPPPRVFGHETAGTIVKVGARVRGFKPGDRVALHHHVPCMKCHACRHKAFAQCPTYKKTGITAGFEPAGGGYAGYVHVMSFCMPGVVKIPSKNTFAEGAMLEPVNTVLKGVKRLSLLKGDVVLVAGQGPIGLMFTRLLALRGMKVVATDLMETRLKLAKKLGAKLAIRGDAAELPELIKKLTAGRGLDAAVIATPIDAVMRQAQGLLRGGGQILLFAHTKRGAMTELDLSTVCVDEKDLMGSYSSDVTLQPEVARLVFSRKLDVRPLITHTFGLNDTAKAVELAAHPTPESLKVVVSQE
ncbi:MAG TPA: alcohol dehydrogenase catalytic domain-containing protein [Roseimicrobium sp.]|nr:alcohol dehydrogenase catalytic domain-containing protein [Roseimicrobium sp.]